jgi:hypothetical protein
MKLNDPNRIPPAEIKKAKRRIAKQKLPPISEAMKQRIQARRVRRVFV